MIVLMVATVGALFLVWIVTGVRLVLLARHTRHTPELMLGAALVLQAGIGFPLSVVAPYAGDLAGPAWLVSGSCVNAGMALLFAFTARVFHDATRWAWILVGAAIAVLAIQAGGNAIGQLHADPVERTRSLLFWGSISVVLSGLAWGWTGYEALRFHSLLRKRAALGLADPVVVNRMLLWGTMCSIAVACVIAAAVLMFAFGEFGRTVVLPIVTASCGLLVSVCMILAFWPPAAYLARVRAKTAAS